MEKDGSYRMVDTATRLLSTNYVKNTASSLMFRQFIADGSVNYDTASRQNLLFQNIPRLGEIAKLVIVGCPQIHATATSQPAPAGNYTLSGSLKSLVQKCDVHINNELVFSETNLEPYFDMCEQLRDRGYDEHHLDFVKKDPSDITGSAGQSIDSAQNLADIISERK